MSEVINMKKRKQKRASRKNLKPKTFVLSVRCLDEILDYETYEKLKLMVQRAVSKRIEKHKAEGKKKISRIIETKLTGS